MEPTTPCGDLLQEVDNRQPPAKQSIAMNLPLLAGTLLAELGNSGKLRENMGGVDKMLVFHGKLGRILRDKHKKHTFGAYWEGGGGVLSEVLKEKWGKMGGNVGAWLHKHVVYECLWFMYVCVVQLGTVYIHILFWIVFPLAFFGLSAVVLPVADEVCTFKGLRYIPIKVICGANNWDRTHMCA